MNISTWVWVVVLVSIYVLGMMSWYVLVTIVQERPLDAADYVVILFWPLFAVAVIALVSGSTPEELKTRQKKLEKQRKENWPDDKGAC